MIKKLNLHIGNYVLDLIAPLQENEPMRQDDFFSEMVRQIAHTKDDLVIFGYDEKFMNHQETIEGIKKAAKGQG